MVRKQYSHFEGPQDTRKRQPYSRSEGPVLIEAEAGPYDAREAREAHEWFVRSHARKGTRGVRAHKRVRVTYMTGTFMNMVRRERVFKSREAAERFVRREPAWRAIIEEE